LAVFVGTFENKVDRKCRVSIPAPFRQALGDGANGAIVAYRSQNNPAIEACGMDFMEQLKSGVRGRFEYLSQERQDLATLLFADAHPLQIDGDGRIVLPQALVDHAGITERAAFAGFGENFQIWEPDALERFKQEALQRTRARPLSVPLGPEGGGGA